MKIRRQTLPISRSIRQTSKVLTTEIFITVLPEHYDAMGPYSIEALAGT